MDSSKLHYVMTIAEYQSISRAAEKLHISQPALTRYVNKLEDELGVKLFDRSTLPIRLTYAGEWYIDRVGQISAINSRMEKEIQEIVSLTRGRVKLGMSPGRLDHWIPHLLPRFKELYPHVDVQLVTGGHHALEQAVVNGEIDLAFLPLPIHSLQADYTIVATENLVLAVPAGHALLEGKALPEDSLIHPIRLNPREMDGQTFLVVPKDHGIFKLMEDIFSQHKIKPGGYVEYPDSNLTYKLACENMGITFVQDTTALYPGYYKKPYFCTVDEEPVKSYIAAVYKKEFGIAPLAKRFLEVTLEAVGESPYLQISR